MNDKKWNLQTIVLYGINGVIGSGIFLLPGSAYDYLGPASLLAYVFVFVLVMSIALCFAECGSMFEQSGGPYLYAKQAFGDFFGYEVGVMKWIVSIIAWATMAVGFSTALSALIPQIASPVLQKTIAIGIILTLSLVNLLGINIMAYLNNIATVAKLIPMAIFILGGIWYVEGTNYTPFIPADLTINSVSTAFIIVFFAFTGFENLGVAAGDMENPKRNVPLALIISMSFVSVVFFFVQFNCVGILGADLGGTKTPVADAMGRVWGSNGLLLVTLGTLISIGGLNIASSFNTPRCAQALAEGRLLPKFMMKNNKYNVPYISVLITGGLAILLTLTGSFAELAAISVISRFSQYIPTCIAVPVLRKKSSGHAGYKVPFGLLVPVIAVVASLWLLANADLYKLVTGLGAMVLVAPLYILMKKYSSVENSRP
ncbi:APC family permease [Veillonella sp.]|uniref:APC family permease n=1 Tax=Veillonella sp. TaxID=1926307 RepID=UPI0025D1B0D3|nr:APC family permease [Veillonella sp.]